jgi:cell division protein FtsB
MKVISFILVTLLVLLQYRLWIGNGSLTDVHHLQQAKQEQIKENEQLRERNQALAAEVHDLKHGFEAIEERARSEMGLIKKDETFYHVINQVKPEPAQE